MKKETRGMIEQAIDEIQFSFKNDIEAIQEITHITNFEEYFLGYVIGYLRKSSEEIVLSQEKKITENDEKEISGIIRRRTPEIRIKITQYLNT